MWQASIATAMLIRDSVTLPCMHFHVPIYFEQISAKQQIDLLTAQAWFSESRHLEGKVSMILLIYNTPLYLRIHNYFAFFSPCLLFPSSTFVH